MKLVWMRTPAPSWWRHTCLTYLQESVDEAYAALRDLNVEVKRLVVDPSTGKVKDAVDQFGSVKSGFRPVFEYSNDLEKNIDDAVSAPANTYRF